MDRTCDFLFLHSMTSRRKCSPKVAKTQCKTIVQIKYFHVKKLSAHEIHRITSISDKALLEDATVYRGTILSVEV